MPRVLIVDDDRDGLTALAQRLRFALREFGLEVDTADSASSAVIQARTCQYDLMIVDAIMPGTTGLKFIEQMRATQPNVPIILMSGADQDFSQAVRVLDLFAFVPKPIEFSELRNLVVAAIEPVVHRPGYRERGAHSRKPVQGWSLPSSRYTGAHK
ncbi:response regulator [Candidatus Nitrospira bockiana]